MDRPENVSAEDEGNNDDDDCQIIKIMRFSGSKAVDTMERAAERQDWSERFESSLFENETQPASTLSSTSSTFENPRRSSRLMEKRENSLANPAWEMIDPNPDIYALFQQFNKDYFWEKLTRVEVRWSDDVSSRAGFASHESSAGFCWIGLSKALLQFRPRKDLVQTLLHEMIHAYLFVTSSYQSSTQRGEGSHGTRFQEHMHRINRAAGTNITIYHSFHEEVASHKTWIWQCQGTCKMERLNFEKFHVSNDKVKRKWWVEHKANCGGKFAKVQHNKNPRGASDIGPVAKRVIAESSQEKNVESIASGSQDGVKLGIRKSVDHDVIVID